MHLDSTSFVPTKAKTAEAADAETFVRIKDSLLSVLHLQLSSKVVYRVRSRSVLDYRRAHRCRAIRCCDSEQVYDLCSDACGD